MSSESNADSEDHSSNCGPSTLGMRSRCGKVVALLFLGTVIVLAAVTAIAIILDSSVSIRTDSAEKLDAERAGRPVLPSYHECGHPLTDELAFRGGLKRPVRRKRVVGGEPVKSTMAYPWLAKLLYEGKNGDLMMGCTGTLISSRFLLTVAHCVKCSEPIYVELNGKPERYRVLRTEAHPGYSKPCETTEEDSRINQFTSYLEGSQFPGFSRAHDIAVIYLETEVPYARPICLPLRNYYRVNTNGLIWKEATIAGWGSTAQVNDHGSVESEGEVQNKSLFSVSNELRHAAIRAYHMDDCRRVYEAKRENPDVLTDDMFCAGDVNGNFCYGDSGAPYFVSINNRSFIAGLASFGHDSCDSDVPSIFTKIIPHLNWILDALRLLGRSDT